MRLIGKFADEGLARLFSRHLTQVKIDNQIAIDAEGMCEIWVIWEDEVKQAEQLLSQFQSSFDEKLGRDMLTQIGKIAEQKKQESPPPISPKPGRFIGQVTLFLIIVSLIVAVFSGFGRSTFFLQEFFITDIGNDEGVIQWHKGLTEVADGEFWRLITPILISFGFGPLLFNMLWLYILGNRIEERKGSWLLGIFIVIVAAVGNLAQYFFSNPYFGGMSGVLYGLLGYSIMKAKYEPGAQVYVRRITLYAMIVWYLISFTGLLGRMPNVANTAGLLTGLIWGYVSSKKK